LIERVAKGGLMEMFAVIMAGGSGTRFWPLSRKVKPKQFLEIIGPDPMIVETYKRLSYIVKDNRVCIILGKQHLKELKGLLKGKDIHIIAEPFGRNTAPCIALGVLYAKYLGYEGAIAFLPADHYIADNNAFINSLKIAEKLALMDTIVTLGIVPVRPEIGYGYIRRVEEPLGIDGYKVCKVKEFVEKPDLETANRYLESGEYYWNAGIFVAKPDIIIMETKKYLPDLYNALISIKDSFGTEGFEDALKRAYEKVPNISFDYGIMEKTESDIYVIPTNCGWSDVGSWFSIYELRNREHDDNSNLIEGEVITIDCKNSFISAKGKRIVACIGLEGVLIVDTPDAILVADINRTQDVRRIVDRLKEEGKSQYI